jgi:hypothetical protein
VSRKSLNEFLAESLDSADFQRAFLQVSEETATRPVRPCRCTVVAIPSTAKPDDFAHVTPGTVTAFVAKEGEPLLNSLTETVEAHNSKGFDSATDEIKRMEAEELRKITASASDPASKTLAMPAFAAISYAGKSLIGHLYVDEVLRVNAHPFPYNGGHLDINAFSMIEYYRPEDEMPLRCVLLIRQPQLSDIEKEALRLVPSGSANNVAVSLVAPLTPALLQAVLIVTPYAAQWLKNQIVAWLFGAVALASIPDEVLASKEFASRVKSLPPEVTAAELLQLRTDILLRDPPQ